MTNKQIKMDFITALYERDCYIKAVSNIQYITRCPYCGDTDKRQNDGHFYIRVNPDDDFPIVYNCFLCPAGGVLSSETLSLLEIDSVDLKSGLLQLNKTSRRVDKKGITSNETKFKSFDYKLPEIKRSEKTKYIETRLGRYFSNDDFKKMKVITSLRDFLILNKVKKLTCDNHLAFLYEKNYVGFLTHGNSHILLRDITEKEKIPWIKYPINDESRNNRVFYTIESELDIFTEDEITVNMSEGVFDAVSICYNLGYNKPNTLNLCISGKYYDTILLFLLGIGIVGSNVVINIFSDNDGDYNKKKRNDKGKYKNYKNIPENSTSIDHYRKLLKNYKYLFKEINVYYNLASKDFGIPSDGIVIKKYKL